MRALASVDEGLGQVLAASEEIGLLDDTLVVFASDNSYFWASMACATNAPPTKTPSAFRWWLTIQNSSGPARSSTTSRSTSTSAPRCLSWEAPAFPGGFKAAPLSGCSPAAGRGGAPPA
ncbi:MAG: sulfatase-like hydrolase/transferase [bacterium]|nr:sulfatase-like hydrolase/transferase [bacterium]